MITVWYHDPAEVEPRASWTGLVPQLTDATYRDITDCSVQAVTDLFGYARPDAVIDVDDDPVLSIEQTMMNPSGHNLPQRFSCLLRAAELNVAGTIYHPEYARRTYSDPNPRYTNPRVALAQLRMLELFRESPPSLSVYWPTDETTLLPDRSQGAQENLARVVNGVLSHRGSPEDMRRMPEFVEAANEMRRVIDEYGPRIRRNASFRRFFPDGLPHCETSAGYSIDPPPKAVFLGTDEWLADLRTRSNLDAEQLAAVERLLPNELTMVFAATANKNRTDSEHPWPGYFALLDILYSRTGRSTTQRSANMIYVLPIGVDLWIQRLTSQPAAMRIVDAIADLIVLRGGIVKAHSMGSRHSALIARGRNLV